MSTSIRPPVSSGSRLCHSARVPWAWSPCATAPGASATRMAAHLSACMTRHRLRMLHHLLFGCERVSSPLPGLETAMERMHMVHTVLEQDLCHTGTGGFVGSGTIGDDHAIAWDCCQVVLHLL